MLCYLNMEAEQGVLEKIRVLVGTGRYRIRLHAVRHMIEEGFDEGNVVEAVGGGSRVLEVYSSRCDACFSVTPRWAKTFASPSTSYATIQTRR